MSSQALMTTQPHCGYYSVQATENSLQRQHQTTAFPFSCNLTLRVMALQERILSSLKEFPEMMAIQSYIGNYKLAVEVRWGYSSLHKLHRRLSKIPESPITDIEKQNLFIELEDLCEEALSGLTDEHNKIFDRKKKISALSLQKRILEGRGHAFLEKFGASPEFKKLEKRIAITEQFSKEIEEIKLKIEKIKIRLRGCDNNDANVTHVKMLRNTVKAYEEFIPNPENFPSLTRLISPKIALDALLDDSKESQSLPFRFTVFSSSEQGRRDNQEDRLFIDENDERILWGMFDGHAGSEVAAFAATYFKENFDQEWKDCAGNVHQTFTKLFDKLNKEIEKSNMQEGSTAITGVIPKQTEKRLLYVATLGDSEGVFFCKNNNRIEYSLIARMLSWASPSEAKRLANEYAYRGLTFENIQNIPNPKFLRATFKPDTQKVWSGVNMPRALGDPNEPSIVSKKPKLTIFPIPQEENMTLVVATDGLWDYATKKEVAKILHDDILSGEKVDIAKKLVDYALHNKISYDNTSVIVIKIANS